jgi:hypothetical protein
MSINRRNPTFLKAARAMLLLFLAASAAFAKPPSRGVLAFRSSGPQITYVGLYINDIRGLDLKASTYTVDFYIWFRWRGDIDPSNFEFLNGSIELKEHPYRMDAAGVHYVSYHCRGVFHIAFDYHRYPLDEHQLVLEMEDGFNESWQLQYMVDSQNMQNLRPVTLTGWTCGEPQFEVSDHTYHTNFGEPTEKAGSSSTYSRLECSIDISRHSVSIFLKTFLGPFIAVAIAFIAFLFKPGEVDPRFAVGVAAIFAAVSAEFVAMGNLPEMPYLTLADKIHLFSLFMIFLSLLLSCLSLRFFREGKTHLSFRFDRFARIAFPITYAVIVLLLTYFA